MADGLRLAAPFPMPYVYPGANIRILPIEIRDYALPDEHGSARFSKSLRLLWLQKEATYGHPDNTSQRIEIGC